MTRYLHLYWYFLIQRFKILMEYRLNFFIGASSTVMSQAASLAAVWVVMRQIPALNGWSFYEIMLVYGLLTLGQSITHMFADNLWTIGFTYVRSGDFDRFLVRPINPLFHLLADRFCHDGIGNFITGAVLVGVSMQQLHIAFTPLRIVYIFISVLSGGLIFIALNLITASSVFWIIQSTPVTLMVFTMNEFAKYPISIYHRSIRILLTWIIPYGFVSFYPASYLLGRDVGPFVWFSPIVAVVFIFTAYRIWLFGLRHYSSTGS